MKDDYKVKLINSKNKAEYVVLHVSPDIGESRTVSYEDISPLHMPGSIVAYSRTSPRSFQISGGKFINDTEQEAIINNMQLQTLRSWCLPRFGEVQQVGQGDTATFKRQETNKLKPYLNKDGSVDTRSINNEGMLLGAPPPVLLFSAYVSNNATLSFNINRVPVVIESFSFNYPSDVDYIMVKGLPSPIIMTFDIQLKEVHSPREYEKFNLSDFKDGNLKGW